MNISDVTKHLETIAPISLQEDYDNSGLIVGDYSTPVRGIIISLDCLESTIMEAISKNCNMVVCHHPIVFSGLKRFNNSDYVQRTVQLAIKNDIAIYAIHTNLDNVFKSGVNERIAERLKLQACSVLNKKIGGILKLVTYCPYENSQAVQTAMFAAGAGNIGNYSECSFSSDGTASYKGNAASNPSIGVRGVKHFEKETKIEVILKDYQKEKVLNALIEAHPYEEVAFEIYPTLNSDLEVGSGIIGELEKAMSLGAFLSYVQEAMELDVIRHTDLDRQIKRVAICGGSGQFLLNKAIQKSADVLITSDFKYHQFFDADKQIMICDIGHYESEKYTIDLLYDILTEKISTFAVLKTEVETNPVKYFTK